MKISVLGAGTWGMALARLLCLNQHEVTVYSAIPSEIDELASTRLHKNLPGMIIPDEIIFTKDLKEACIDKEIVVFAVPSIFVRSTANKAKEFLNNKQVIVDVAKGIEADTLLTMSEVIKSELGEDFNVVAFSGPTHAEEVAKDLPTTIVSACKNEEAAKLVQDAFMNSNMRVYTNDDVLGVELCGALKNIIALASGVSTGLGFGDNSKAAIITRGIAEMKRLGLLMGAKNETFSGLAGIGDLIVTCTSIHSRNNRCGMLLGQGVSAEEAKKQVGMVVEGINALPAAMKLKEKYDVDMPIIETVNKIVFEGADPKTEVIKLMNRDKKNEID
ncbi:MAG: NAD(P)H-dependent glycerol-3-phosphate dehydrogenase [Erysipelotrichaceae bacterium]|nr:NAD(P)H-dependent glycerol-3-phosphate dehydrogenase [Erysipelotrichaceae bacterium]